MGKDIRNGTDYLSNVGSVIENPVFMKCLIVFGITVFFACISNVAVMMVMYLAARIFKIVPQMNTDCFAVTVLVSSLFLGTLSSALGIIAAAIGWKKYSASAAIICALLIVYAVTNFIAVSPGSIVFVLLAMTAVFTLAAVMYHILADGIEKWRFRK